MNHNVGMQHLPLAAWTGTAAIPRDITKWNYFGFSLEATAAITTDAVFKFQAAPGTDADPCVPGTFVDVKEIPLCDKNVTADDTATVTIPAGTPAGQVCTFTIPCRPNKFVQLVPVATGAGDVAKLRGSIVLSGPQV